MSTFSGPVDRLLGGTSYLPRVGRQDGRALEDALGDATLFDERVPLAGAVLEATYAATDPEVVRRLRAEHVPLILDSQSLRFVGRGFLAVQEVAGLPYAPSRQLTARGFRRADATALAEGVSRFGQESGAAVYGVPALPLADDDLDRWVAANRRLTEATCDLNGKGEFERKPVIAVIAPGRKAMRDPGLVLDWLVDLPISGVYLQPTNFQPTRDSTEKLSAYLAFVRACGSSGLAVLCGRLGAFGLVVQAVTGAAGFDSGLGEAEGMTLSTQLRPPPKSKKGKQQGGSQRIYFEALKTTLQGKHALPLLTATSVRSQLTCGLGCCRFRGFDDLPSRRRAHYLRTRVAETEALGTMPQSMRRDALANELASARETSRAVRRALMATKVAPPQFDHLDRWLGLLAHEEQLRIAV